MCAGLGAEEVRRRLARAARHEETGRRVLAFYLVEMEARRLYQATGHGSTAHYAETRLGLDRRRTAELMRVGAKLLELRAVDRAFCEGRLGWAKVLVVARMAAPEHEAAWLQRALELDVRALTLLAASSREGGPPRAAGDAKGLPEIRFPVSASVSPLVFAKLEQAQRRLGDELGRAVDVAGLLDTLLDEFLATQADGTVPGRKRLDASIYRVQLYEIGKRGDPLLILTEDGPLPVDGGGPSREGAMSEALRCDAGVRNHHVAGPGAGDAHAHGHAHDTRARDVKTPPAMRRRVFRRDGHRCRSCRTRHSLHAHHKEFRGHGGRTLVQNLITLCVRCHGLVHAALLVIEGATVDVARFVDSKGQPVEGPEQVAALERDAFDVARLTPPAPGELPAADPARTAGAEGDTIAGVSASAPGEEARVTLAGLPAEVDPAWWRRHAHLVRDRGDGGSLCFRAGLPEEAPPRQVAAPPPASQAFDGLVGQEERVRRLQETAEGTRALGTRFPHTLLTGPAGTGKSTLARAIAAAAQQPLAEVSAPLLKDRVTWVRFLADLAEGSVLFLDEAHALPLGLLEVLLQALAERQLTLVLSDGVRARQVTLRLPAFTLVAATTDEGALPAALRSRFGLRETLVHYGVEALSEVALQASARAAAGAGAGGLETTAEAARRLAQASRGTPREVLRLLERARERAARTGVRRLDAQEVERLLSGLGYDDEGLDPGEQRYVQVLRESSTPIPLARLARLLGSTPRALTEHVEPWLFHRGLVRMTPGGRTAGSYVRLRASDTRAPNVRQTVPRAYRTS
jgi:Holliday junction DNA helicase RuvB